MQKCDHVDMRFSVMRYPVHLWRGAIAWHRIHSEPVIEFRIAHEVVVKLFIGHSET